ncbi:hypothetical protein AKJ09_01043 [Labilithrix luteola]|uniref:Uncharacterized protein n=1 Tax=Labilithrix luteola TaxID=1391654 RepID=A0A0K1PMP0_9BACT|nr:MmoB/DmpM family protein [Labilithrix luteola]AKU94379.1 hypothetical protein AKJ09_01043 [Labilithrix luteola]
MTNLKAINVGPVLVASELGRAMAEVICDENADAVVTDRGSYLRILVPSRCTLTRSRLEAALQRRIAFPSDLEPALVSFKGAFEVDSERACWHARGSE